MVTSGDTVYFTSEEKLEPSCLGIELREIRIEPLNRGFILHFGDDRIGFEDLEGMVSFIESYYGAPTEIEGLWEENALFKRNF